MGEHQPLRKNILLYIDKIQNVTINYVAAELESNVHIILRWYLLLIPEEIKAILKKIKLLIIAYLDLNK